MKKEERMLKATEVAFLVGIAPKTLEVWYAFKRKYPDNEYAKMLPDYEQQGARGMRLWKESDIEKIIEFQKVKPNGRGRDATGLFGDMSYSKHYYTKKKKEKEKENGKKETNRNRKQGRNKKQ